MQLTVERRGDVHIVRVREAKLTYPILTSFFEAVRQVVEGGADRLLIDLAEVSFVDSASIGCLVDIHWLLRERGGVLKLCRAQTRVATMLSMTGVPRAVEMHHDEAEALAAFPERTADAERVTTGAQGLPGGAGRPRLD
jgi:anti-sigma B factor antagonist